MEKWESLPQYTPTDQHASVSPRRRRRRRVIRTIILACIGYVLYANWHALSSRASVASSNPSIERLQEDYATCSRLRQQPHDPSGLRERNARFVEGQLPTLIRNATVWTGEPIEGTTVEEAREGIGYVWTSADVLLENGLITRVEANIPHKDVPAHAQVFNAEGRQLTAGIVDMHSHTGVDSLPNLRGNDDTNELSKDITPFVRSIDGLNPLDHQLQVIKSGGVTTSLILPGSGNNMGGEAFVIKHSVGAADGRPELSIADMLADPEHNWRYMKMACGENAKSVYGRVGRDFGPFSRLGEAWEFRHAFEQATKLKTAQDDWCETADRIGAANMGSYLPQELQWESLVAVLRGQVMVNTHCYTIPDLESFIGYTNEFKFAVRAFHHAHQTYLVPETLKRVYGGRPPAAALFADNMHYKAESYVASEQAGKILYEAGITPVYVSDNPVINAQHVVLEAAKAYKNGLKYHVALAGVTSASAELLGLGERIGKVKPGFDADVAIWDSDPLSFGATPVQVFIDGVAQFEHPVELKKPLTAPLKPMALNDLQSESAHETTDVVFTGISSVLSPGLENAFDSQNPGTVIISDGTISCIGGKECMTTASQSATIIQLSNGHIVPPATAFGSLLGLEEISAEDDTSDGSNSETSFSAAIDGLSLEGKNLAAAYAHGVTKAISAPQFSAGGRKGASVAFRIAAHHALEESAVIQPHAALHYTLTPAAKGGATPSLSAAIAELRAKLLKAIKPLAPKPDDPPPSLEQTLLHRAATGHLALVIDVHSADTIAALIRVKSEIDAALTGESATARKLRLVLRGGAEAPLLAPELAAAKIPVILAPLFAYATSWDQRRALTGAPLTNGTAIDVLHAAGVKVAIGVDEDWEARDLYVQAGIVRANSGGAIGDAAALALVSSNIYDILGIEGKEEEVMLMGRREFVVSEGNPLEVNSRVRAVADGRGKVTVWE